MENKTIRKSNALVTAKYVLTKAEQKIILSIIATIDKKDTDFHKYQFYIKDFFDSINAESKQNYVFIKNVFKGLLKRTLEIKEGDRYIVCNWLSKAELDFAGYVEVEMHPSLKPYLLQLKRNFTEYNLSNVLCLNSSSYSIRIYELLKLFENTGIEQIDIEEFTSILGIPKSYAINNIKNVLNMDKEEISEKTDIEVDYSLKKQGRKFKFINFAIKQKESAKKEKQTKVKEEGKCPFLEELTKQCFERINQNGYCPIKETKLFDLPFCKFCRI